MSEPIITIKEHIIENVIHKSRFIAHIKPVHSEDEAKQFIADIKQRHKDATHHCSAYTVGAHMNIQKQMMMESLLVQLVCRCWIF